MLAGKRAVRVGDHILREIAIVLLEKVNDPRVKGVTVTGIRLTDDLKIAKVYYSVMGQQNLVNRAQAGLDSAKGFVKREIALRMKLKHVPEIIFVHDPTLESGSHMERLFEAVRAMEHGTHKEEEEDG